MNKKLISNLLLFILSGFIFATEIDTTLLANAQYVQYIEDTTPVPPEQYNTAEQIRDIGRLIGKSIMMQETSDTSKDLVAEGLPAKKYQAMRIYSNENLQGADIIYISKDATVGTIKALCFIISGYIEIAYNLPTMQADELAQKICWWNTNHYDDRNYFSAIFNPRILEAFTNETAIIGLADSYKNWAGHTRIVIPNKANIIATKTNDMTQQENIMQHEENLITDEMQQMTEEMPTNATDSMQESNVETNKLSENNNDDKAITQVKTYIEEENLIKLSDTQKVSESKNTGLDYRVLLVAVILAALILIILILKVIKDIAKR